MPRSTQDSLIPVLLLWLTLLSVFQVAFIIFFFTSGHHPDPSKIIRWPESTPPSQITESPLLPPGSHALIRGQMFTYKAVEESGKIKWSSRYNTYGIISEDENGLTIREDGYYLLNLQVTLKTTTCQCNGTRRSDCMVTVRSPDRDLLQGWINTQTCSTGLLGKVEKLSQGTKLEIEKKLNDKIDETESLTHLDIIMLQSEGLVFRP